MDFFSNSSYLLKKSLMENFIFCAVKVAGLGLKIHFRCLTCPKYTSGGWIEFFFIFDENKS